MHVKVGCEYILGRDEQYPNRQVDVDILGRDIDVDSLGRDEPYPGR
jgi:hypothetical protein